MEVIKCSFNNLFKRNYSILKLLIKYKNYSKEEILSENKVFSLCGRIIFKRNMGKASFVKIRDFSAQIQIYLSIDFLNNYKNIIFSLALGDIVGVKGYLFITNTGELSLKIFNLELLNKILNSFPDKWHGLKDKELCYRYRYLDLMVNDKSRELFVLRSKLINAIRNYFIEKDYLEVETPIMQMIAGGAAAEPFKTHHNYLNSDLYLRISPELYLKRLLVGGFEKVFEIGKSFRNEGVSNKHHPEFTMIEFYEAYSNYNDFMQLTEDLFRFLSNVLFNSSYIIYMGKKIDFSVNFDKISFVDAILKYNEKLCIDDLNDRNKLLLYLTEKFNVDFFCCTLSELQEKIFDLTVEKNLVDPVFIVDHPLFMSPLARKHDNSLLYTERFELYIAGKEIANGFSELNDPVDQESRFVKQIKDKKDIDMDMCYDEDYINALKYGLPPAAGEGIGIDRLVMLFTDSCSIKDVILFPLMKGK